jgi:3-phenylpropionate/trans-cinnamate dioxygenase ferredoxin reductase subunit
LGVEGDRSAGDCAMSFRHNGRKLALATIGRDLDCPRAELAFEQEPVA